MARKYDSRFDYDTRVIQEEIDRHQREYEKAQERYGYSVTNSGEKTMRKHDILGNALASYLRSAEERKVAQTKLSDILDVVNANLKRLDETGVRIEIRMIMVPEHNMSEGDLRAAGEILSELKHVSAMRLLAYHQLARSKFQAVGHPDTMPDVPPPDVGALEKCASVLRRYTDNVVNSLK